MKKSQRIRRDFDKLKSQLNQIEQIARNSKDANLWSHEAAVRKKIKALKAFENKGFNEYKAVYDGYLSLLDNISVRLLRHYNKRNKTSYVFEEIIESDRAGYINSGIIPVLINSHIPALIARDFVKYFPENPKDEYESARIIKRHFTLHLGQTNTGKTFQAIERLKQAEKGIYLAPLRILALENYEKLNRDGVPCNLITGEEELLTENAMHVCSTVEKLDTNEIYDVAVIDEIQMIANSQRGQAWTRALLGLRCREIHVCGAFNAKELIVRILEDCGDEYEVKEYYRQTPLEVYPYPFTLKDASKGDALIAFSIRDVLQLSKYFLDRGIKNSVIYGDLPPEVRRMQYQSFIRGESKLLISTDAIGMGVNLPIKRVIFMSLQKFDGEEVRYITSQEVKQIGGRAGRKGIYEVGYVGCAGIEQELIREHLETEDETLGQAVLGPSEGILQIKGLPLREKLALWSTSHEKLDYYRKMDIRDYLLLLGHIKAYRLPEDIEYRLMKLPFDVNDPELLLCFLSFVEEFFVKGKSGISKPVASGRNLSDMERYYQKLNIYYSFTKAFNIGFEPEWVYSERSKTSSKINKLLLKL